MGYFLIYFSFQDSSDDETPMRRPDPHHYAPPDQTDSEEDED